ncbi:MAG: radical SAM protein [Candidatus Hermodarchaeota archaeon]
MKFRKIQSDFRLQTLQIGKLPQGCQLCRKGEKTTLFITGICGGGCFYCPVSEERRADLQYANERPIQTQKELLEEIEVSQSRGVAITGGEPLLKRERVQTYATALKETFGEKFHIHLYTQGIRGKFEGLEQLIDELRIHPKNSDHLRQMLIETKLFPVVGVELPAIPGNEQYIIDIAKILANHRPNSFLNLNELEISETNYRALIKRGFQRREQSLAAVQGSKQTATEILTWIEKSTSLNAYYCSASIKDAVQLPNRLFLRAQNISEEFDIIEDKPPNRGLLIRGVFRANTPEEKDTLKLHIADIQKFIQQTLKTKVKIDYEKHQLLLDPLLLSELTIESLKGITSTIFQKFAVKVIPGILEEYPTFIRLETSFQPLL